MMKLFEERELRQADRWSQAGGQALHLFGHPGLYPGAPGCFKRTTRAAHLFDQDADRLSETARRLGVRRIVISHRGTFRQHVDLCGRPLKKAMAECCQDEFFAKEKK